MPAAPAPTMTTSTVCEEPCSAAADLFDTGAPGAFGAASAGAAATAADAARNERRLICFMAYGLRGAPPSVWPEPTALRKRGQSCEGSVSWRNPDARRRRTSLGTNVFAAISCGAAEIDRPRLAADRHHRDRPQSRPHP